MPSLSSFSSRMALPISLAIQVRGSFRKVTSTSSSSVPSMPRSFPASSFPARRTSPATIRLACCSGDSLSSSHWSVTVCPPTTHIVPRPRPSREPPPDGLVDANRRQGVEAAQLPLQGRNLSVLLLGDLRQTGIALAHLSLQGGRALAPGAD